MSDNLNTATPRTDCALHEMREAKMSIESIAHEMELMSRSLESENARLRADLNDTKLAHDIARKTIERLKEGLTEAKLHDENNVAIADLQIKDLQSQLAASRNDTERLLTALTKIRDRCQNTEMGFECQSFLNTKTASNAIAATNGVGE